MSIYSIYKNLVYFLLRKRIWLVDYFLLCGKIQIRIFYERFNKAVMKIEMSMGLVMDGCRSQEGRIITRRVIP